MFCVVLSCLFAFFGGGGVGGLGLQGGIRFCRGCSVGVCSLGVSGFRGFGLVGVSGFRVCTGLRAFGGLQGSGF